MASAHWHIYRPARTLGDILRELDENATALRRDIDALRKDPIAYLARENTAQYVADEDPMWGELH